MTSPARIRPCMVRQKSGRSPWAGRKASRAARVLRTDRAALLTLEEVAALVDLKASPEGIIVPLLP